MTWFRFFLPDSASSEICHFWQMFFFRALVSKPKKPHDMVSFFFAGFGLFRNVQFLQDKEQAWTAISRLPRPWELARILQNFIFYVNQASKPHFNEFPFFQKISRVSSRVNYAVSGLRGRLLIKKVSFSNFFHKKIILEIQIFFFWGASRVGRKPPNSP